MLELSNRDLKAIARSRTNKMTIRMWFLLGGVMFIWIIMEYLVTVGYLDICSLCVTYTGLGITVVTLIVLVTVDLITERKVFKQIEKEYKEASK